MRINQLYHKEISSIFQDGSVVAFTILFDMKASNVAAGLR